jgi:hypothetical protein
MVELSWEIDRAATFAGSVYVESLTYNTSIQITPQAKREPDPFPHYLNERPCVMRGGR